MHLMGQNFIINCDAFDPVFEHSSQTAIIMGEIFLWNSQTLGQKKKKVSTIVSRGLMSEDLRK